jgi:hypothetical protein
MPNAGSREPIFQLELVLAAVLFLAAAVSTQSPQADVTEHYYWAAKFSFEARGYDLDALTSHTR